MSIDPPPEHAAADRTVETQLRQANERISELSSELAVARSREQSALSSAVAWRTRALTGWADGATGSRPTSATEELNFLRSHSHAVTEELEAIRHTLSWRVTKPLRSFRSVLKVIGR